MTDQQLALEIRGLEKIYAASKGTPPKHALKTIDLSVKRGRIFGLLGPNGAGKSTLINILAGLVRKTAGSAIVWGFDIDVQPRNAKASIGIVPQEIYFDAFFSPREMLDLQAGFYGIAPADRRTEEILDAVSLLDKADSYSRHLSGGMKRRLLVARAMVHNPPILVLDEPTAGVDVELRQNLWRYVRKLNRLGVTIVLTTHYLEEAQELCDEIAIINHGEVVACDATANLLNRLDEKVITIRPTLPLVSLPEALVTVGGGLNGAGEIVIRFSPSHISIGYILQKLQDEAIEIADLSTEESDLEDIFLRLTSAQEI